MSHCEVVQLRKQAIICNDLVERLNWITLYYDSGFMIEMQYIRQDLSKHMDQVVLISTVCFFSWENNKCDQTLKIHYSKQQNVVL